MSDFATPATTAQPQASAAELRRGSVAQAASTASQNDRPLRRPAMFGRMSAIECKRRLLHIVPGLLPTILWFIPHKDPLSWDCRAWLGLIIGGIGVATAVKYRRIARTGETSNPACILGYTVPVFLLLMLIPAHAQLGL
ncbi:MAG: hypothetical protein ISQ06_12815, partial [Planctomycetaceae bacterium]|nr:hypothetical protein [Planctomycetaceae bacterium]